MAKKAAISACLVALATVLGVACSDEEGGDGPAPSPSPGASLSMAEWGEQVCRLSVRAAETLDVPGLGSPEVLTLEARKERAAQVLAPRANALARVAEELAAIRPPREVDEFSGSFMNYHEGLQTTVHDLALVWQQLVDSVSRAQSAEEITDATELFRRNARAIAFVAPYRVTPAIELNPWIVSAEMRDALAAPEDCGILNRELGSCPWHPQALDPDPSRWCSGLEFSESAGA